MKSRKLWAAILAALVTTIGQHFEIDPEVAQGIIQIATTYILGQGAVDTAKALKSNRSRTPGLRKKNPESLVGAIKSDLDQLQKLVPNQ